MSETRTVETSGLTLELARRACANYHHGTLPEDLTRIAVQCVIDWHAVTVAALADPVHLALVKQMRSYAGLGGARVVGQPDVYPAEQAALINGATAHALDFDDVNLAMSGHPSAVIFAAALAMAQEQGSSGKQLLAAFVAGYETACAIGQLMCPDHLKRGFHSTATICIFGATVACAHLRGFDPVRMAMAMGIAGTRAAGLKAVFGTMVKPLHAGLAARSGLEAVQFVDAGFDCCTDILERPLGFVETHGTDFHVQAALSDFFPGRHLRNTLFKYEAACYGANGPIRCTRELRDQYQIEPAQVASVHVRVDQSVGGICVISRPVTGLQGKFSLEGNAAFILAGIDTGSIQSYTDDNVARPDVIALRDKVHVELQQGWPKMQAEVEIVCTDGRVLRQRHDAGLPESDLGRQGQLLTDKFHRLVSPVIGQASAASKLAELQALASLDCVSQLNSAVSCMTSQTTHNRSTDTSGASPQ